MIYVIVGPTACGKTKAANILAVNLNAPIINGDAFQIYKDMNIGTNKISADDPCFKRYHLLNIVNPSESYSVKEYQKQAREILNELLLKNKDVIITGGTGLYIKALLFDYVFNDEHTKVDNDLEGMTNNELHNLLRHIDPKESEKIHENNRKRVIRAIMLYRNNKISKTDMLMKQEHKLVYTDVKFIFILPNRDNLYAKINNRVDEMISNGLVDEVKMLLQKYSLSETSKQGIGYKEIIEYIDGKIDLSEAISLIKQRTRNYAKRQITFFSRQFPVDIKIEESEKILNIIK